MAIVLVVPKTFLDAFLTMPIARSKVVNSPNDKTPTYAICASSEYSMRQRPAASITHMHQRPVDHGVSVRVEGFMAVQVVSSANKSLQEAVVLVPGIVPRLVIKRDKNWFGT